MIRCIQCGGDVGGRLASEWLDHTAPCSACGSGDHAACQHVAEPSRTAALFGAQP